MKEHIPIFIIAVIGITGLMTVHHDIKTQRQTKPILQRVELIQKNQKSSSVPSTNVSSKTMGIPVLSGKAPVLITRQLEMEGDTSRQVEYLQ